MIDLLYQHFGTTAKKSASISVIFISGCGIPPLKTKDYALSLVYNNNVKIKDEDTL